MKEFTLGMRDYLCRPHSLSCESPMTCDAIRERTQRKMCQGFFDNFTTTVMGLLHFFLLAERVIFDHDIAQSGFLARHGRKVLFVHGSRFGAYREKHRDGSPVLIRISWGFVSDGVYVSHRECMSLAGEHSLSMKRHVYHRIEHQVVWAAMLESTRWHVENQCDHS
jgi:hypothetical protein